MPQSRNLLLNSHAHWSVRIALALKEIEMTRSKAAGYALAGVGALLIGMYVETSFGTPADVRALGLLDNDHIIAAADNGIFRYIPSLGWKWIYHITPSSPFNVIAGGPGGDIVAGTLDGTVYVYSAETSTWAVSNVSDYPISAVDFRDSYGDTNHDIWLSTFGDGLYNSHDGGKTWTKSITLDAGYQDIWCLLHGSDSNETDTALSPAGLASVPVNMEEQPRHTQRRSNRSPYRSKLTGCIGDSAAQLASVTFFRTYKGLLYEVTDNGQSFHKILNSETRTSISGVWTMARNESGDIIIGARSGIYLFNSKTKAFNNISLHATLLTVPPQYVVTPAYALALQDQVIGVPTYSGSGIIIGPTISGTELNEDGFGNTFGSFGDQSLLHGKASCQTPLSSDENSTGKQKSFVCLR